MSDFINTVQPDPKLLAFVLGAHSYRVSIHTQQLRALQLLEELCLDEKFLKTKSAVVIGGGVTGLTIAAGLGILGKAVIIFEQSSFMVPLQRYNRTRYVHPHAVNWPTVKYSPSSDLPFLNWYADYAHPVAKKLYLKFENIKSQYNLDIHEKTNTKVSFCELKAAVTGEKEFKVHWGSNESTTCDSIFFAEGFGIEQKLSPYDNFSYWEDTSVIPRRLSHKPARIAIVGDGDGALIDAARSIFHYTDLERIYDKIARDLTTPVFRNRLRELEQSFGKEGSVIVDDEYRELFFKQLIEPKLQTI